jgi:acetyl esterase/lipase
MTVPADAPPLFIALAADDPFFANGGFGLIDSWRTAKKPVELHLYEQGGHGFGMYPTFHRSRGGCAVALRARPQRSGGPRQVSWRR